MNQKNVSTVNPKKSAQIVVWKNVAVGIPFTENFKDQFIITTGQNQKSNSYLSCNPLLLFDAKIHIFSWAEILH